MSNNLDKQNRTGISYTDLTHQDIMEKVQKKFRENDKLRNYQGSDIGIMMAELFAGMFDMLNYNIERTAEESFMSTLKRYRSAAKHAAGLAYDIQRPSPARATVKLKVTGSSILTSGKPSTESDEFTSNPVLYIPKNSQLSFEGNKYLFTEDVKYVFSAGEIADLKNSNAIDITLTSDDKAGAIIQILQGESKMVELKFKDFSDNFDVKGNGNSYQSYFINDKTFSNFYGENDPFGAMTIVSVGETYASSISAGENTGIHTIHRQSLITGKEIEARSLRRAQYYMNDDPNSRTFTDSEGKPFYDDGVNPYEEEFQKNVWVRTSSEVADGQGVEIKFGDGVSTSLGCKNSAESVYVQYLSTKGSAGNSFGVIGQEMNISTSGKESWVNYLSIKAILESNIVGGGDIESIESIKNSAPGMFQTFDRLVTKKDYVSFLKTITSPIDVKNAIAWGEQDEMINSEYHNEIPDTVARHDSIKKLFNIVLYTVVGSLYEKITDDSGVERYRPRTNMHNAMLDNYSSNVMFPSQNYITIIAQQEVVKQLKLENKLLDGSVPVENFKFEILNNYITDSAQSTFQSFMRHVGIYKTPNYNPKSPDDFKLGESESDRSISKVLPAVVSTVPFNMSVVLSNPNTSGVLDVELNYTDVLGKDFDINTAFDIANPSEFKEGYTSAGTNNYVNMDNTRFDYSEDIITVDTMLDIEPEITSTKNPFPIYSSTKPDGAIPVQAGVPELWLHSKILESDKDLSIINYTRSNAKFSSSENTLGGATVHRNEYSNTIYKNLMEGLNSTSLSSGRMFGYTKTADDSLIYEVDAALNSTDLVRTVEFIKPHNFAWTPWGVLAEEVERGLNKNLKSALNQSSTIEGNALINNFKFFELTCNVEEFDSSDADAYLRRLSFIETTQSFASDIKSDAAIESISVKAGEDYIDDVFALINRPDGSHLDRQNDSASVPTSPQENWVYYNTTDKVDYKYVGGEWVVYNSDTYVESDIYSIHVHGSIDFVEDEITAESTLGDIEELYNIRVVNDSNDSSLDKIEINEVLSLSSKIAGQTILSLDGNSGIYAEVHTALDDLISNMNSHTSTLVTTTTNYANIIAKYNSAIDNTTVNAELTAKNTGLLDIILTSTNAINDGVDNTPLEDAIKVIATKLTAATTIIDKGYTISTFNNKSNADKAEANYFECANVNTILDSVLDKIDDIIINYSGETTVVAAAQLAKDKFDANLTAKVDAMVNNRNTIAVFRYATYIHSLIIINPYDKSSEVTTYKTNVTKADGVLVPEMMYDNFDVIARPNTDIIDLAIEAVNNMQVISVLNTSAAAAESLTAYNNLNTTSNFINTVSINFDTAQSKIDTAIDRTEEYAGWTTLQSATTTEKSGYYEIYNDAGEYFIKKLARTEKIKRYLDSNPLTMDGDSQTELKSIGWDGENVSFEGNYLLMNYEMRKRLAEDYKFSITDSIIHDLEFYKIDCNGTDLTTASETVMPVEVDMAPYLNTSTDNNIIQTLGNKFKNIEINAYTNYAKETKLLKELVTYTLGNDYYTLTLESINRILQIIGNIQNKFSDYMINSYRFRSGDNFISGDTDENVRLIGNYSNLPTHFSNKSTIKSAGTNYTDITFELEPDYKYIEPQEFLLADNLDLSDIYAVNYSDVDYIDPYAYNKEADSALARIISTLTDTAANTNSSKIWVPIPSEESLAYKQLGDTSSGLVDSIPSWLGFDNVSFTSYYETNEVNVPQNRYTDKISIANQRMKDKNLATVKTVYLSPIFHQFELAGEINVKHLTNVNTIENKIKNELYKFLDEHNDFGSSLYVSNLIEIIEGFPEVINANVKLQPYNTKSALLGENKKYFDLDKFMSKTDHPIYSVIPRDTDKSKFRDIVIKALTDYISKYELNTVLVDEDKFIPVGNVNDRTSSRDLYPSLKTARQNGVIKQHLFEYEFSSLAKGVTERTFLNELCKTIINETEKEEIMTVNRYLITRHKLFFMLLASIHNDFRPIIENNMLNSNGDIDAEYAAEKLYRDGQFVRDHLRGGYSLSNEIVQVYVNANVKYKG
jgi:hypothetical protein